MPKKGLQIIAAVVILLYLVNCCTPLRLHVDMIRYFLIKDCMEFGCPPDSDAAHDYMPLGYTALLIAFSKLHILKSWTIVLLNCVYLFAGCWLVRKMFRSSIHPFFFLILVLLNWCVAKFTTHALSEMQYLFFSMASLYSFYRYSENKKVQWLLGSFALGGLAFLTRSVGVALFAGLVSGLGWMYRKELALLVKKNKILVLAVILAGIGVVVFSKQLGLDHYTGVFNKATKEKGIGLSTILRWHFTEWGEMVWNISSAKVIDHIPFGLGKLFFLLTGILFFAGFVWLLFIRKNQIPFIVKAYMLWYCLLMFNWPFYDPRFWVPVWPLIAATVAEAILSRRAQTKEARGVSLAGWGRNGFLALYFALGVVSMGYLTYTSLNKKVFARTQAGGVYRNDYETLFYGKPLSDTARTTDPGLVDLLRRYNR